MLVLRLLSVEWEVRFEACEDRHLGIFIAAAKLEHVCCLNIDYI